MNPATSGSVALKRLAFFRAQGRADFGQINDEGRALPCTGPNGGSLTVWFRISSIHDVEIRNVVEQSQHVPLTRDFKLSPQPRGNVFNGEFDSGSERTLAAWIRHASRARFFPVAIQGKV